MLNILLVIIGSIVYGFLPIFVKNIIPYNYSSISIVFYRYLFTSIALFIIIIIRKKSFKINKKQFIELFIFSVIGLGLTFYLLSQSLLYISAGLMNMIHFGYPVVVLILMTLIYKEKINLLKILSALSSIIGILTNSLQLLNNIFVFYNFVAISILCTIFSLGLLLYGVKQLGSSLASILNMFEPTTTVIVSVLIYNEKLTINIIIGSILIILSTIFMILSSNSNNK